MNRADSPAVRSPRVMSFLIFHGWGGSGPDHWQAWLANRLSQAGHVVRYPRLSDPDQPRLETWLATLRAEIDRLVRADGGSVVICHSPAVLLWLHYANTASADPVDALWLVSPPGPSACTPEVNTFFPVPLDAAALARSARQTRLVCTDADPYCPERAAIVYGQTLDMKVTLLPPGAGHINVVSGYGPWPQMEQWCVEG